MLTVAKRNEKAPSSGLEADCGNVKTFLTGSKFFYSLSNLFQNTM